MHTKTGPKNWSSIKEVNDWFHCFFAIFFHFKPIMYILMNGAPHAGILHSFCRNAKKGYTSAFMLLVSTSSRLSSPYFLGPKKVEEMKKYGQSKRKPPFSSFPFQIHTPSTLKTFFVSLWTFFKFSSYLYISQTSSSRRLGPPTAFKF